MEDKLIEVLEHFGHSVIRQGSLAEDEPYEDNFFTFWNNSTDDGSFYDDEVNSHVYSYDVNFYSKDPANVYATMRNAIALLKKNGFIVSGDGYDVASDEPTHTGRGANVLYLKRL